MAATEKPADNSNYDQLEFKTVPPRGGSDQRCALYVNVGPELKERVLELQKSTGMTQVLLITRLLTYALDRVRLTP